MIDNTREKKLHDLAWGKLYGGLLSAVNLDSVVTGYNALPRFGIVTKVNEDDKPGFTTVNATLDRAAKYGHAAANVAANSNLPPVRAIGTGFLS